MRLVELLIQLLEAHASTLARLAALLGERELVEALESAADETGAVGLPERLLEDRSRWLGPAPAGGSEAAAYQELEGSVRELRLPALLEFHLWAYPPYRAFIESSLDLNSRIVGPGTDVGTVLVDAAVEQATRWVRRLPLSPEQSRLAEHEAHAPWLRFRTTVLKRIGRRPLGPVY